MTPALIALAALGCYVAAVRLAIAAIANTDDPPGLDHDDEPAGYVPVEFTGTCPGCDECRAAKARVLDRLAASGVVPGLAWTRDDDQAVSRLLGGAR